MHTQVWKVEVLTNIVQGILICTNVLEELAFIMSNYTHVVRPNKKVCVVPVTSEKKLG